ncbi:hypothetical protein, partial [Clavibacter michiganensis]|uniref:hypothetical protein n=1 Tax=Clavibacter michiganensis TaxID=28447 RepID=UPI00292FF9D8
MDHLAPPVDYVEVAVLAACLARAGVRLSAPADGLLRLVALDHARAEQWLGAVNTYVTLLSSAVPRAWRSLLSP